jgi:uncharacterized protein (TIGR02611 family)
VERDYPGGVEHEADDRSGGHGHTVTASRGSAADGRTRAGTPEHHHHDRWAWRRAIRSDPHKYRIYRVVVAIVGLLLILLGAATGWLPGPGGIPLVLLGLAVLASEFEWAHRLLQWAKARVHEGAEWSRRQPRWVRWAGGLATAAALVAVGWLALTLFGLPSWMPGQVTSMLSVVPGVR